MNWKYELRGHSVVCCVHMWQKGPEVELCSGQTELTSERWTNKTWPNWKYEPWALPRSTKMSHDHIFYDLQLQLWSQNWMKLKLWYFLKFGSVRGGSEADTAAHMSLSGHHDFIRVQLKIITAPYPGFILKGSAVFSPSTSGMLLQPWGCVESHKKTDWGWRPMIETSSSKVSCWWTLKSVSCIGLLNHELSFLLFSPCVLKHKPHTSVWFKVPSQAEKAWSNLMEQSV